MRDTERVCRLLRARRAAGWQNTTAEDSSKRPTGKEDVQGHRRHRVAGRVNTWDTRPYCCVDVTQLLSTRHASLTCPMSLPTLG